MYGSNKKAYGTMQAGPSSTLGKRPGVIRLCTLWRKAAPGMDVVVKSGTYGGYLPQGIYGVDLKGRYELRESLIRFRCSPGTRVLSELREGRRLELTCVGKFVRFETSAGVTVANFIAEAPGLAGDGFKAARDLIGLLGSSCSVRHGDTILADYAECRIRECVQERGGASCRLVVYVRFVTPLANSTMENLIVASGILSRTQIESGLTITPDRAAALRLQPYKLSDAELRSSYDALGCVDFGVVAEDQSRTPAKGMAAEPLREDEYERTRTEEDKLVEEFLAQWKGGQAADARQVQQAEEQKEALAHERAELDARREELGRRQEALEARERDLDSRGADFDEREESLRKREEALKHDREQIEARQTELERREKEISAQRADLELCGKELEAKRQAMAEELEPIVDLVGRSMNDLAELQAALGAGGSQARGDLSTAKMTRPNGWKEKMRTKASRGMSRRTIQRRKTRLPPNHG